VGAENLVTSGDLHVLHETAVSVSSQWSHRRASGRGMRPGWRVLAKRSVWGGACCIAQ
jgi:hypothetical protein